MPRRKIVYFLPPAEDGGSSVDDPESIALRLARGVVDRSDGRYEVELISVARLPRRWTVAPGLTVRRLAMSGRPRDPRDGVSWEIPEAIADADLVHLFQAHNRGAEVGLFVARQQRKPVCITDLGPTTSPLVRQLGLLDLVDRVIACSDFSAARYQTSAPRIVVKGGVDSSRFVPSTRSVARDRVLYVGPLSPHNGVDRLIEAVPPELPLTVCGSAGHEDYRERLQSLAVGKAVKFVADTDDDGMMLDLYHRAWATVLPAVDVDCYGQSHDGVGLSGMTLLESMACGTPAVASRLGSLPEWIDDGETGFLFDDQNELADRLRRLASEPGLADRMGQKARLAVERQWDVRVAGATLRDVYEGLIARPRASERAA